MEFSCNSVLDTAVFLMRRLPFSLCSLRWLLQTFNIWHGYMWHDITSLFDHQNNFYLQCCNVHQNYDSFLKMYLHLQVGYCTKGGATMTHLYFCMIIFHFKVKRKVRFIISILWDISFSMSLGVLAVRLCVKLFDMYTRIKSPNTSYAAPVCYANRGALMKPSWIIQEQCSTRNAPQEQIHGKRIAMEN